MLPVLLDLKFIKIYTMGLFLVLAFFWASFILWRLIRLSSFKEEDVFDALFNSLFAGLIMGRLVYVLLHFKEFGFNILKFILINGYPGLSLYGTYLGIGLGLYLWSYLKKIRFSEFIDYYAPSALLAMGIGKLGSFFSGSEVGIKTDFLLSAKYANMDGMRHLTPLYESMAFFLAAYIAYRFLFEIRKEKIKKGFNLFFVLWVQGLVYFLFDNMKEHRLYFMNYSFNKVVSGALLLTFSFYFVYYFRNLLRGKIRGLTYLTIHHVKRTFKSIHHKTKKSN